MYECVVCAVVEKLFIVWTCYFLVDSLYTRFYNLFRILEFVSILYLLKFLMMLVIVLLKTHSDLYPDDFNF